jgi:hypothetical protein
LRGSELFKANPESPCVDHPLEKLAYIVTKAREFDGGATRPKRCGVEVKIAPSSTYSQSPAMVQLDTTTAGCAASRPLGAGYRL